MQLALHLGPRFRWGDYAFGYCQWGAASGSWCPDTPAVLGPEERARWVGNTNGLQHDHPLIQIQVKKLTQLKSGSAAKAASCFDFVLKMRFSVDADPTVLTAPDVLRRGRGDTHTKAVLFVSMLRALNIPARIRIVTMGPAFLHGLIDTAGRRVNHAISEVFIDDRWLFVDAYCADPGLALAARVRLLREGLRAGYGVHMNGDVSWDGKHDALGHFCVTDPSSLPLEDLGVYDDLNQLRGRGLIPRDAWSVRARWRVSTVIANRRVQALRRSLRTPAPNFPGWPT